MRRWIFAIFASVLIAFSANATVNDGHVTTTVGYVTHELDTRQDEFPAQSGTKAMTFGDDAGEIGAREVKSDLGSSTSDDSLPTVSAVNDGLDDKQDAVAANNTNTVLTYTGTAGNVGAKGVYQNSGTYANQMDNLVTAGTFNTALRNGLESEFVCAETDPSNGQCWAWSINNNGGPWNYFYMDNITEVSAAGRIVRNADGTITITGFAVATNKTLAELAPGLEVGKTYKYSINSTSSNKQMLLYKSEGNIKWYNNTTQTITADMLNRRVYFYTSSNTGTSDTISEIKITAVDSGTPVGASGTILPNGYTPLEYIESTGTQYIDTGISPTNATETKIVGQYTGWAGNNDTLFGALRLNGYDYYGFGTGGERWRLWYGSSGAPWVLFGAKDTQKHTFLLKNKSIYIDDLTTPAAASQLSTTTNRSMYLFCANYAGTASYLAKAKIFSVTIKENNTIIQDLIPARRNSDGEIGMYDIVRNTFLTNVGTGNFTAGPDANNNLYLPQNQ